MKAEPWPIESLARFLCALDQRDPDELRPGNMAFHSSFDPDKFMDGEYDLLFDREPEFAPDGIARNESAMLLWRDYVEKAVAIRQFIDGEEKG